MEAPPEPRRAISYRQLWKAFRQDSVKHHAQNIANRAWHWREHLDGEAMMSALTSIKQLASERELLRLVLEAIGISSGVAVGLNLPNVDIRFFSSEAPDQTVLFHSAPRLFTRVLFQWLSQIFQLAAQSPSLSGEDKKFFQTLEMLCHGMGTGMQIGTGVRDEVWRAVPGLRRLLHAEHPLPVDAYSLKMASIWVQEMLRAAAARKDPK